MAIKNLIVVSSKKHWHHPIPGAQIISAREYLSSDFPHSRSSTRVFNLCQNYTYQSLGYYVSLLAEARGHTALPSVATIRDFRMVLVARSFSEDIDELIQSSLKNVPGNEIQLKVFHGQTEDQSHKRLASSLNRLFPAPMLNAQFTKRNRWQLSNLSPIAINTLSEVELEKLAEVLSASCSKPQPTHAHKRRFLYDLAIVTNPEESNPPSNEKALLKFTEAAKEVGFYVERISTNDIPSINEFDAVFIRETTGVDHPTYRLSRLAYAEGLVVIDDPWSILRSANKVYLAESLQRAKLPAPNAWILTKRDLSAKALEHITHPIVLKLPDGSFSKGVRKASTVEETLQILEEMLKESELILAQEFLPSDYDWRIGVLDHQPLFACKYFMAKGHWQIYNWSAKSVDDQSGRAQTVPISEVPFFVLDAALKASRLIGDGLYGVDLKQIGERVVVIEVNDNPNIDAGIEDAALGSDLYLRIARSFRRRIELARM